MHFSSAAIFAVIAASSAQASALRRLTTACQTGDNFCRSQNLNGGDFRGSYCKYWMEEQVCQAPHLSTDEAMAHIPCSCDDKPLACPTGDAFCQSQTLHGGNFSGSYCKYWMEEAKCQAPHMSTDEAMAQIECSCSGAQTTTKVPVTESPCETSKAPVTESPIETTTCPSGDSFCQSQTLNGGDFSGSYCKYWMEEQVCQAPHLSTDEAMAHIPCSCDSKTVACPTGDAFCQSQTVNGGDFSGSYCKYWMEEAKCQAPHMSTNEGMAQVKCSCDGASTTTTTGTVAPKTTALPKATTPTTSTVASKTTTTGTVAPTTTTTAPTTTTTTEAPVGGPSGTYCGEMKLGLLPMKGSLTVTDSTFDISVGGFVDIKAVAYTMDKEGKFDIDFTNPDIAKLLAGLNMSTEDAKSKIAASYEVSKDSVKVTLPVGALVVTKDQC